MARGYSNRIEEKVASLVVDAKKSKDAEKVVSERAKKAEKKAAKADEACQKAEEARKKAEEDLTGTRYKHSR